MLKERLILVAIGLFSLVAFIRFIPRQNRRKGSIAFLMFQAIIWLCDMPAFKYGLLSAPVREFPKATDLPITIDYLFYPVLFSIFYVHRKINSNLLSKIIHFFVWVSVITLIDIMMEKYTCLLKYEILPWWGMWIYIGFLFYLSQVCCNWFFKDRTLFQVEWWKPNEN